MRKLLIVVGPSVEDGFLTLPLDQDRPNAGQDSAEPSFSAESPRSEGERTVSPRAACLQDGE